MQILPWTSSTIARKMITEPNFTIFEFSVITEPISILFLELLGLGKQCEQKITESLCELFWELYSVFWLEELPNRNCFGINSVIFLCVMRFSITGTDFGLKTN